MRLPISSNRALLVRLPVRIVGPEPYELTLALPIGTKVDAPTLRDGYETDDFDMARDRDALMALHARSGFSFTDQSFEEALSRCLPGGVKLVRHSESGNIVSTMMARHLASPEFPFGGRIDWLATDPGHRGKGLGRVCVALATKHLIDKGYENIWVTTHPHRTEAIRLFSSLGYRPTERTLSEYDWPAIERAVKLGAAK